MSPQAQIEKYAQSIYLAVKNRYFDDIASEDGQLFVDQIIDWTNQYLDELENIVDGNGNVVNWTWNRQADAILGTATQGESTIDLATNVQAVLAEQHRRIKVVQGSETRSTWAMVGPDQIDSDPTKNAKGRVTRLGNSLVFSRAFNEREDGGDVTGDVVLSLPRLSRTDVRILSLVKPKQLLVLGVAKNTTLPDIVQGGLSPSYVQKYNDLLQSAIARYNASALGDEAEQEDFSYIHGVGF